MPVKRYYTLADHEAGLCDSRGRAYPDGPKAILQINDQVRDSSITIPSASDTFSASSSPEIIDVTKESEATNKFYQEASIADDTFVKPAVEKKAKVRKVRKDKKAKDK